jgi:hypothetical protein
MGETCGKLSPGGRRVKGGRNRQDAENAKRKKQENGQRGGGEGVRTGWGTGGDCRVGAIACSHQHIEFGAFRCIIAFMTDEITTRPTLETILERIQEIANDVRALKTEVQSLRSEMVALSTRVEEGFRRMDAKFDVLNNHVLEIHAEQRLLDQRVSALERKPS